MHHLDQTVNYEKNQVIAIILLVSKKWETRQKVHWEVFPSASWYRQGLQVFIRLVVDSFWCQTNVTSSDIILHVFPQAWPIIFPADQLYGLINAKMPYKKIIVLMTYHLGADDLWDIWEPLVLEHSLNVLSIFRKA